MIKGVVKNIVQLFNYKREINMVLFMLIFVFKSQLKEIVINFLEAVLLSRKYRNSISVDLTKSKIEYLSTQGIANNDVIDRTKLRKLRIYKPFKMTFNELISLWIGFVCGILNVNNKKIEIQPLNMVFK